MPRIISFAWTTPALVAQRKTATRREWKPQWAAKFHEGDLVDAWSKVPFHGGERVAQIRLTADPALESTAHMPDSDYESEGFAYLDEIGEQVPDLIRRHLGVTTFREWFDAWRRSAQELWVVRFVLESDAA